MPCVTRTVVVPAFAVVVAMTLCGPAAAQQTHEHAPAQRGEKPWHWQWDANVFVGWNYQYRRFRDFQKIESQNWFAVDGERGIGKGRLRFTTMFSLEPFTIQHLGSPQVFQTGETFQQAPLIDYQHPHDLFMQLGATYTRPLGMYEVAIEAAAVGSPSLGPQPFMHRPSATDNPQVPLSHHQMDSTHITPGALRVDVARGGFGVDASWFRGEEPDENRTDLDLGRLDSWALRGRWARGRWSAQVSGAHLNTPEWVEPYFDVVRLTASVAYERTDGSLATLLAWGQNRTVHGVEDGYLAEVNWRPTTLSTLYARAENTTRDIFGGGRHPLGFTHFHPLAKVGALTIGYVRDVWVARGGRLGVGADATAYHVPPLFEPNYGQPWSFHVFARYRPAGRQAHH